MNGSVLPLADRQGDDVLTPASLSRYRTKCSEGLALLAILAAGFAMRYPLVTVNLPVAVNTDERISLGLLDRLHAGGWNPEWFNHPTFYYYLMHIVLSPFGSENVLAYGRVLNLIIGCALVVATYGLARQVFRSPAVSLIAAALTMFSPLLVKYASYISPDILSACLSVMSLALLGRFYQSARDQDWLAAMAFAGLAMSTKYPAVVVLIAYLLNELFGSTRGDDATNTQAAAVLDLRFPRWVLTLGLAGSASLFLIVAVAFPLDRLVGIAATQGGVDSTLDGSDMQFLESVRSLTWMLGLSLLGLATASWRFARFANRFCTLRPYAGIAVAGVVFLMASPFVVVSPRDFLYDVGIELKSNMLGPDGPRWLAYFHWYVRSESVLVLGLFIVGVTASVTRDAQTRLLGIFLVVSYLFLGSANRGYDRYLTPLLPVVFVLSGSGAWIAASAATRLMTETGIVVLVLCGALLGYEMRYKLTQVLSAASFPDASYFAYVAVTQLQPRNVLYSGFMVPSTEWKLAGMDVRELSRSSLSGAEGAFRNQIASKTVIALDGIAEGSLGPSVRATLLPIWSGDNDSVAPYDQLFLYRPK